MKFIRSRVLSGEFMAGAWCNLGSTLTAEMAARMSFDWILFDQEHGPGDSMTLLHQIQAVEAWPAAPLVRIAWNEMPRFKRTLDLGACGIIVPYVQTREEPNTQRRPCVTLRKVCGVWPAAPERPVLMEISRNTSLPPTTTCSPSCRLKPARRWITWMTSLL